MLAERRSGFLADKWDVYAQLALTERARGRPGAAFEASERLRAREMLELLDAGTRVSPPTDTAADLVAREQDLRRRIAELTLRIEGPAGGEELRGPELPPGGLPGKRCPAPRKRTASCCSRYESALRDTRRSFRARR